jgi:hypothetical protein
MDEEIKKRSEYFYLSIMVGIIILSGVFYYLGTTDKLIKIQSNNTCINNQPSIYLNCSCPNISQITNNYYNYTISPNINLNITNTSQ